MERFWTLTTYALAATIAWWVGLHNAYRLLAIFQVIDIALGVLAALTKDKDGQRTFRSNIGLAGVTRRAATWLFILAVAAFEHETTPLIDTMIDTEIKSRWAEITVSQGLAYAAAFFEFTSIVENARRMGVRIPRWFIEILKKVETTLGLTAEEKEKK